MVRGTFSPARAWRPAVVARLARTLGAASMQLSDSLRSAYRYYPSDLPHSDWVDKVARQWADEATELGTLIEAWLLRPSVQLTLACLDEPTLAADFLPFPSTEDAPESWVVRVSLGVFPKSLSLCNRVLAVPTSSTSMFHSHAIWFADWDDEEASIGMLNLDHSGQLVNACERICIDVAHLVLLHEIAHGEEGHRAVQNEEPEVRRLIEASADIKAGTLFCRLIAIQDASDKATLSQRLVDASYFLTTLLYRNGSSSFNYHLPATRLRCFMLGASLELGTDLPKTYHQLAKLAWDRTTAYSESLLKIDNRNRFVFWNDMEALERDRILFETVTWPNVQSLRTELSEFGFTNSVLRRR